MEYRVRRGSLVWPMIMIGAGVILLMNTLGMVSWSIWAGLWRLWPIILIAIGLDLLIGRRSLFGSLVVAVLLLGVLGLALAAFTPQALGSAAMHTISISQGLDGANNAEADIDPGAANLTLHEADESAGLVEGTLTLAGNEQAAPSFWRTGDTAHFRLHSQGGTPAVGLNVDQNRKPWELRFNPDIPLRLALNTGIGNATVDLTHLKVIRLAIGGGIGNATIHLPRSGQVAMTIDGGIGSIHTIIPPNMAARVQIKGGVGGVDVSGNFKHSGDEYVSPGYDTASDRVDIEINGGIGRITVERGG